MAPESYKPKSCYCWFCRDVATVRNPQGLPCCRKHKETIMEDKCPYCNKEYLDVMNGTYGEYLNCPSCKVNFSLYKYKKIQKETILNEENKKDTLS